MGRLREEVENRIEVRSLLVFAGFAWVSIEVFDTAPEQFAMTLVGSAIVGGAGLVADAFDLQEGVRYGGLGLAGLFASAALFVAEEAVALPAALGLVGLWLVLDGVQSVRHGGIGKPAETRPDGAAVYQAYLRRRIRGLLGDRPRPRTELHEAMDADPDDIDAALAGLRERDLVTLQAGAYHRETPASPGRLARAQKWLGRSVRRVARPVTVAVRDDDPYAKSEPNTAASNGEWGSRSKTVSSDGRSETVSPDERTKSVSSDERTESAVDRGRVRQRERE
jgi:hypothetical protein